MSKLSGHNTKVQYKGFTKISKAEEMENDKERIFRKFNFGQNIGNPSHLKTESSKVSESKDNSQKHNENDTNKICNTHSQITKTNHNPSRNANQHNTLTSNQNQTFNPKNNTQKTAKQWSVFPGSQNVNTRNKSNHNNQNYKESQYKQPKNTTTAGSGTNYYYNSIQSGGGGNCKNTNTNTNNLQKTVSKNEKDKEYHGIASIHNSKYSGDTERESNNHMLIVNNKILTQELNIFNDENKSSNNSKGSRLYNSQTNNINLNTVNTNTKKQSHGMNTEEENYLNIIDINGENSNKNLKKMNNYTIHDESNHLNNNNYYSSNNNDSNSETSNNENNTNNNNNYIRTDNNDITMPPFHQLRWKNKKMQKLFSVNSVYEWSSRWWNDEINTHSNFENNKDFKFISNVREENSNVNSLNLTSFLKLSSYAVYNILSFTFDNYNEFSWNRNKLIATKINWSMNNLFDKVINNFKEKYSSLLWVKDYCFKQKTFLRHKKKFPLLDLVIRAQISTTKWNKCYQIGYKYLSRSEDFYNIWKFDLRPRSFTNTVWFSSEIDCFNGFLRHFGYFQPISVFSTGDIIEIHLNIFNKNCSWNPFSIEWTDIETEAIPVGYYEKTILKSNIEYNSVRSCEIENMIHVWRDESSLKKNGLIWDFKKYTEDTLKSIRCAMISQNDISLKS